MANDLTLATRRAIVAHLRSDAALTALVGASSIYPEQPAAKPAWPFVRYGTSTVLPDRAAGLDGSRILVGISAFAHGPGPDGAAAIGAQVARLEEAEIDTETGDRLNIFWTGSQLLRDTGEADAWHSLQNFEIEVAAD